mmetsp:Transcript_95912/g.271485  ORF Transcript_95912/g.271485 Transcript_95912/m.271485 type:complete len:202 (-) Transcript_95912:2121-2726(-)
MPPAPPAPPGCCLWGGAKASGPELQKDGSGTRRGAPWPYLARGRRWAPAAGPDTRAALALSPPATSPEARNFTSTSSLALRPSSRCASPSSSGSHTVWFSPGTRSWTRTSSFPRLSLACHCFAAKTSSSSLSSSLSIAKSNCVEFHTGFRLFAMTSVLNSCVPTFATTNGSEASPAWIPRSVFLRSNARSTRTLSLPPATL